MKRYIYKIQYNSSDPKSLYDKVFVDAYSRNQALRKLNKQFPGAYGIYFCAVEPDYPFIQNPEEYQYRKPYFYNG